MLVNAQEWGCFSVFLRADDVTRTMSKGGVLVKNPVSMPGPPPPLLSKILDPPLKCVFSIYAQGTVTVSFVCDNKEHTFTVFGLVLLGLNASATARAIETLINS